MQVTPCQSVPAARAEPYYTVQLLLSCSILLARMPIAVPTQCGYFAGSGILRTSQFDDVRWDEGAHRAALADVLRVHEWSYVLSIKQVQLPCSLQS